MFLPFFIAMKREGRDGGSAMCGGNHHDCEWGFFPGASLLLCEHQGGKVEEGVREV